jgi:hypothetical protein
VSSAKPDSKFWNKFEETLTTFLQIFSNILLNFGGKFVQMMVVCSSTVWGVEFNHLSLLSSQRPDSDITEM